MAYTTDTAKLANCMKEIQNLRSKLTTLRRSYNRLQIKYNTLKSYLDRIEREHNVQEVIIDAIDQLSNPILSDFIRIIFENLTRNSNGQRYHHLEHFFTLISYMGEHYFNILTKALSFPTYRTVLRYRKSIESELNYTEDIFNGDIRNILRLMENGLPCYSGQKLIMMVDAASVTPSIKVKRNGQVSGLIAPNNIDIEQAELLIQSESEFTSFLKDFENFIIRAEFVVMIATTSSLHKPFPICCISSNSGTCTLELKAIFESIIELLRNYGFNIYGLGTDGDNAYNSYSRQLVEAINTNFNEVYNMEILDIIDLMKPFCHFSDPFHLAKRDRYRKVSSDIFRLSPLSNVPYKSVRDLETIGIAKYILSNDKARKMEDSLPLKLFNNVVLRKIIDSNDICLFISMLPSTLLLESIHSKSLSRQQRFDALLFGASIVLLYVKTQEYAIQKNSTPYKENHRVYYKEVCFKKEWCYEYISTCLGIASLLVTEKNLHLGSCGSHFLEHYFGSIRRLSRGEDTHTKFLHTMKHVLLEHYLTTKLDIESIHEERRSDSGNIVTECTNVEQLPFSIYLSHAKVLLNSIIEFPEDLLIPELSSLREKIQINEFLPYILQNECDISCSTSTNSTNMVLTGGFSNVRRWKADNQIFGILNDYSE